MHVCAEVPLYVCVCMRACICAHVCARVCVHACVQVCSCMFVCVWWVPHLVQWLLTYCPFISATDGLITALRSDRELSVFHWCMKGMGAGTNCDICNCGRDKRRPHQWFCLECVIGTWKVLDLCTWSVFHPNQNEDMTCTKHTVNMLPGERMFCSLTDGLSKLWQHLHVQNVFLLLLTINLVPLLSESLPRENEAELSDKNGSPERSVSHPCMLIGSSESVSQTSATPNTS